jgi:hypothetical protein
MHEGLRIAGKIVLILFLWSLTFGAAIFGVPTVYSWWRQYECWRRGPDSVECWWLDLLKHPYDREGGGRTAVSSETPFLSFRPLENLQHAASGARKRHWR